MKNAKQLKVYYTQEEHPACFGNACEGDHYVKYLVIESPGYKTMFMEGHYAYKLFEMFLSEFPETIERAKTITIHAEKNGEVYMIRKMITELEQGMMK